MSRDGQSAHIDEHLKENPLVNPPKQDFNAPPLGLFKPEHVEPAVDRGLAIARQNIKAITDNPGVPSFENTIHALAFAGEVLEHATGSFFVTRTPINTPEVQKTTAAIMPKLTAFGTEVSLNEALFKRIKAVYDTQDRSLLSEEQNMLLDKTYNDFANNGALLQGQDRVRYGELSNRLSGLTQAFSNNIANSAASLKIVIKEQDAHRLAGIPQDYIDSYRANAKRSQEDGITENDYVILMTPPPGVVFEYAEDRSLRQEARETYVKIGAQAPFDNTQVVHDILATRHEIANLLGFENYAAQAIRPDTRMAQNPQTVMNFLQKNASVYLPAAKALHEELEVFAAKRDGLEKLESWDAAYYTRLLREETIGLKQEEIRPYFELENVLEGMFAHAEKLYGVKVREAGDQYSKLHEDVRTFEILDAKSGDVKALYFLDPYARPFKGPGAWMNGVRNPGLHGGQQEIPIAGNFCNLNKPAPGKPTLLDSTNVITFFHEFGHGLHCMMGEGTYPSLTGTRTPRDYVELPSQINERWAFKPEVLKTYAKHHETGAPMPDDLIEKLQKLDHFNARVQGLRQTKFGLIDMALHMTDPAAIGDLKAFEQKTWAGLEFMKNDAPPMALTFSHIMAGGYSAGYYSYKWADALVADAFERFEEQGLYKGDLCKAFKECMIVPGGTRNPDTMFRDFMEAAGQGRRDLDPQAMLRAEGMLPLTAGPAQNFMRKKNGPGAPG